MHNLFLAICLIVWLFIVFRYFKKFKVNSFYAVVINYYICIITGFIFLYNSPEKEIENISLHLPWIKWGIYTGALFVPAFYLMALSVEKINITVATVANKMSLIIPISFSLIFLKRGPDDISLINILGIMLALLAIVMTSVKQDASSSSHINKRALILLPASIFLLGGIIDTLINYTNFVYLKGNHQGVFPLIMFATAACTGTIAILFKSVFLKDPFIRLRDLWGGIILGIPNYFSLYFLLKSLSEYHNDAALVYPVVNIGTIILASLMAVLLFNEKLSRINLAGISFAIASIILVFW